MTRTDLYFGPEEEIRLAEHFSKTRPTIICRHAVALVHNTNVAVDIATNYSTLDVSNWQEGADFKLKIFPTPKLTKRFLDDSVVTVSCTEYPTGQSVVSGHTTAIVSAVMRTTVSLSAGAYLGVEKVFFFPNTQGTYRITIAFTDVYGISQTIAKTIRPDRPGYLFDTRVFRLDRSVACTITIYSADSTASDGTQENIQVTTSAYFQKINEPILLQFGSWNSLDESTFIEDFSSNSSNNYSVLNANMRRYTQFLAPHCATFEIPVERWVEMLVKAASYACDKGWISTSKFNNLREVRDFSLSLVALYSKLIAGNFNDVSIPSHFEALFEALLENGDAKGLLLGAAIWALADDLYLELS